MIVSPVAFSERTVRAQLLPPHEEDEVVLVVVVVDVDDDVVELQAELPPLDA